MVRQVGARGSRDMRMFGSDLTEARVLNHSLPSLQATLSCFVHYVMDIPNSSSIRSTFVVDTLDAAQMPLNLRLGYSFLSC